MVIPLSLLYCGVSGACDQGIHYIRLYSKHFNPNDTDYNFFVEPCACVLRLLLQRLTWDNISKLPADRLKFLSPEYAFSTTEVQRRTASFSNIFSVRFCYRSERRDTIFWRWYRRQRVQFDIDKCVRWMYLTFAVWPVIHVQEISAKYFFILILLFTLFTELGFRFCCCL